MVLADQPAMSREPRQDLVERARRFSVRLLRLVAHIFGDPRLPRRFIEGLAAAGTAIGNNLSEAQSSVSRRQMAQCYRVALRESREAQHGLGVVNDLGKGDAEEVKWLLAEASEFVAMLVVSVRKLENPPDDERRPR